MDSVSSSSRSTGPPGDQDVLRPGGACGLCTVIMDGRPILSCMTFALECDGMVIETAEGIAEDFFDVGVCRTTVLDPDEIVMEIRIPKPPEGAKSAFIKFALRESIDFPIVNCGAMVKCSDGTVTDARVCLNAVWVKPYRAIKGEEAMAGKVITEETAEAAGAAAVSEAKPLRDNGYMVQIAKTMVKRAILACA
jgi:CO/xanthine dehydrogenase FAD-binding subunit